MQRSLDFAHATPAGPWHASVMGQVMRALIDGDLAAFSAGCSVSRGCLVKPAYRHFDVADFLLEHGADINTRWASHEPASILHHLVMN
jgi:hypothetical protein